MRSGGPRGINAGTGLVALVGHPVSHSLSPALHNSAFAAQGLDLIYLAFDVTPERLPAAIQGLRALRARGANVTVPHKRAVLPLLDSVDEQAATVGAVNTIVNLDDELRGYNTDIDGFLAALASSWGRGVRQARCLLLGAGGAARAVVAALGREGAAQILIYNRTAGRAVELCHEAAAWSSTPCRPVGKEQLQELGSEIDLIVNATSLGLGGTFKENPLPADIVSARHFVIDLVYGPEKTALLDYASSRGAGVADGREMLVQQAARSYELWTGQRPPVQVMQAQLASRHE